MKIVVDYDVCESNAVCMGAAPKIFEVRDDDLSYVLVDEVPERYQDDVEQAIRLCPRQAISWVDEA